jgi:dihydroxyacetone kinase-like protein
MMHAVQAFQDAAAAGSGVLDASTAAVEAAQLGSAATTPLVARKGRASYLGERSVGHLDPGSVSTTLLFESLRAALQPEVSE